MGISGITMAMMSIISLVVICISGTSLAFRLDSRIPASRIPNSCVTGTGSTCVFPFKYKDVEYYECTYAESPLPWCATQTDSSGSVVIGKWGDCQISTSSSCTAPSLSLTSCTTEGQAQPWCATSVDTAGDFQDGQYGFCPSSCPSTGTTTTTSTTTTTTTTASTTTSGTTTTTTTPSSTPSTTSTTSTS